MTPPDEEGHVRCGACSLDDGIRAITTSRCRGVELSPSSRYIGLTSPVDLISCYPFQSSCLSHWGDLRDPEMAPEAPMGPASSISQALPNPPYPPSGGHLFSIIFYYFSNISSKLCSGGDLFFDKFSSSHLPTNVDLLPTPPKFCFFIFILIFSRAWKWGIFIKHHNFIDEYIFYTTITYMKHH